MTLSKEKSNKDFFDKLSSLNGVFIAIAGFCATYIYNVNQIQIQKEKTNSEIHATKVEILEKCMKYVTSENPKEREFGYTVYTTTGFEELAMKLILIKNDNTAGTDIIKNIASDKDSRFKDEAKTILQKLSSNPIEKTKQVINYFETGEVNKSAHDFDSTSIDSIIFKQAVNKANELGIKSVLGITALYDSYFNTGPGGITKRSIEFATTKLNGTPKTGIDEVSWLREFLENRYKWYINNSNPLFKRISKRPKFFLDQLNANNLNLDNL